ncbi:phage tail sheath family protein [Paenibacillus glycanilyticus]|uniref:phage tail sheath family protein n=1 Tax=Paenibacillus glycanilyticus TaxID=126569 RepID=UPI001910C053|nr:phage tail sheath family protein [Paenibacillus glycanilyticus]
MAGGTFTMQNKVRPGVYVNVGGKGQALGTLGIRGIAAMALPLSWGAPQKMITLEAGDDSLTKLGYDLNAGSILPVREALKRAKTLFIYRLNTGEKATITIGQLTATAKYGGIRGNDLMVVIENNIDDSAKYDVKTFVDQAQADQQTVTTISELKANDWVDWTGTGALTPSAGAPLAGGTNGAVTNADHLNFLSALELFDFNTVAYVGTDNTLKNVYTSFVKRLRDDEGKKVQAVVENDPAADYEGVISVKNGVVLGDGTILTAAQATAWVAGATAAADVNESLTYSVYDDAVDVSPRYTNSQINAALRNGEFVFTASNGRAVVEQDINSLTSFTAEKTKAFSKNRVIRVLDGINNDFVRIFSDYYLGKVSNNAAGRNLLKSECINNIGTLQGIGAVQNFDAQKDISVYAGQETDAVNIDLNVQPVDSVEKIYITVTVN